MDEKLGAGALDVAAALEPDRQGPSGDPADEMPVRRP